MPVGKTSKSQLKSSSSLQLLRTIKGQNTLQYDWKIRPNVIHYLLIFDWFQFRVSVTAGDCNSWGAELNGMKFCCLLLLMLLLVSAENIYRELPANLGSKKHVSDLEEGENALQKHFISCHSMRIPISSHIICLTSCWAGPMKCFCTVQSTQWFYTTRLLLCCPSYTENSKNSLRNFRCIFLFGSLGLLYISNTCWLNSPGKALTYSNHRLYFPVDGAISHRVGLLAKSASSSSGSFLRNFLDLELVLQLRLGNIHIIYTRNIKSPIPLNTKTTGSTHLSSGSCYVQL